MLTKLLFETWGGRWFLALIERRANLAIVRADWLGGQKIALASGRGAGRADDIGG